MHRLLAAIFILLAWTTPLGADNPDHDFVVKCGGRYALCGYVVRDGGAERISQRFEVAQPFSGGLAAVRVEGRYGYIQSNGQMVIAPRFRAAGGFTGRYAEVRTDNGSGVIDRTGRLVVPARFFRIIPFSGDVFIAQPLQKGQQPPPPNGRLSAIADPAPFVSLGAAGLYHMHKGWLTDSDLEFDIFDTPKRGLIWAAKKDADHEDEWGLMRSDGTWQVTPRYHHVRRLEDTRAIVTAMPDSVLPSAQHQDAIRWGAVDRDGKLVVPPTFAHLSSWRGGYGIAFEVAPFDHNGVPRNPRTGILRPDGRLLAGRYFDEVDIRENGTLPRARTGTAWSSVTPDGRLVPDHRADRTLLACAGGLKVIARGEMVEVLRPGDGQTVGRFDNTYFQQDDCLGPLAVRRDGRWYFVRDDGAIVGGEHGYDTSYHFNGDHAAVKLDGKWGVIDRAGAFTLSPSFSELSPAGKDVFVVDHDGDAYWIDPAGVRVAKPVVERTLPKGLVACDGGLRLFEKDGFWGIKDDSERMVIAPRFRALYCFAQGITWAAAPGAKTWCPYGPDGSPRDAIPCQRSINPQVPSDTNQEALSADPYESSVLWARAWLNFKASLSNTPPNLVSVLGGRRWPAR